ncbi:hypothetical protein CK203_069201 [Vitis vinifera]|uniref:Uncharacterized protein n=1 Tax=Vitis vinifera TaxID=29760 RepID=A0A438C229_VITVI|nr:hypothetical protein CK203_069201 [Vitis vinifera]
MASRYRSLSKPTLSLLKSTITKTKLSNPTPLLCTPGAFSNTSKANPKPHFTNPFQFLLSATFFNRWDLNFDNYNSWILNFRSFSQIRCLQSLLPLHTAVSSARLTSCLGIDSSSSRSLSQGMICSANPGV